MYFTQMATKTVSLTLEAYKKLRRARKYDVESFSQVVLRAIWPEDSIIGRELLARLKTTAALFSKEELDALEAANRDDAPPADKWQNR